MAYLIGNTTKEIKNPIRWLFNHDTEVTRFHVKALQDGGAIMIAHMENKAILKFTCASYTVMMHMLFKSRGWRNHFYGLFVDKLDSNGNATTTYQIV